MKILANQTHLVRATSMTWQQHIKAAIRDVESLRKSLNLPAPCSDLRQIEATFATFVPLPYLARIRPGDENDPLLLQVLPTAAEAIIAQQFSDDPNQEATVKLAPGVLRKYDGRALLIASKSCAINCRYCFRRAYPYASTPVSKRDWQISLQAIAKNPDIDEVIISGGEPLVVVDDMLAWLLRQIEMIEPIRRVRIHTRMPIVIPQRITPEFINVLKECRLPISVVVHSNHVNELDDEVANALSDLRTVPRLLLLNQSVLLRGVNDAVDRLSALSWRLLEIGVLPYYLHQLDRVTGSTHFEVPITQGLELIEKLRSTLPGYAVPRYVQEIPGRAGKTILA